MNQRYPDTKNSGVEWIGEVPKHWEVIRLKYVASANPSNIDKKSVEGETPVRLCNYMDVHKNEFITSGMPFMSATATDAQIAKFSLKKGDVIATKDSEDPQDIAKPAVVKEDLDGVVCGYHLTHIKPIPDRLSGFYLFRLFQSDTFNKQFTVKANGVTRYGLSTDAFSDAFICLPRLEEQEAISNHLDKKTTLIDETISKKEWLIELLQEERTALINKAVTRGLDDTVSLKDSGVDCLGMIPEHWDISRLKYQTAKIGDGLHSTPVYDDSGDFFFINGTNLRDGVISTLDARKINQSEYEKYQITLRSGTILISLNGTIGRLALYNQEPVILGKSVAYIELLDTIDLRFVYFLLQTTNLHHYFDESLSGTTIKNLSLYTLRNTPITVPPLLEQRELVSTLYKSLKRIDDALSKIKAEIKYLEEYRTALINEVVTGKRCVL